MANRKLASLRVVRDVSPIEGADLIALATVDSWNVVVKVADDIHVGDVVVYFEIDSWIPTTIAPFLSKGKPPQTYEGVEGEKLRTVKLRGQVSQGLVMTLRDVGQVVPDFDAHVRDVFGEGPTEGQDVTELLGILKWERADLPSSKGFRAKGNFPSFVPKTDQERIQNLTKSFDTIRRHKWEVTEKYDGTSMTVYVSKHGDEVVEGVCSRRLDLHREVDDESGRLTFYWEVADRERLLEKLRESGLNVAIQGELVGTSIGLDIYKLGRREFYLFDVWDIDRGRYYSPAERRRFAEEHHIKHVPVLYEEFEVGDEAQIVDLLRLAEGKSALNLKVEREGLVFKNVVQGERGGVHSFKCISNAFLLKIG